MQGLTKDELDEMATEAGRQQLKSTACQITDDIDGLARIVAEHKPDDAAMRRLRKQITGWINALEAIADEPAVE